MIAALYVQPDGCYADVPDVEIWDEARDARTYDGRASDDSYRLLEQRYGVTEDHIQAIRSRRTWKHVL